MRSFSEFELSPEWRLAHLTDVQDFINQATIWGQIRVIGEWPASGRDLTESRLPQFTT